MNGRRRNLLIPFDKLKILLVRITKNRRQRGQRRSGIIPSLKQEELCSRLVHLGEAQVDFGLQLGASERLYLVDNELARAYCLLRHFHEGFRLKRIVKSLIDREDDLETRGCCVLVFRLSSVVRAGQQVSRSAKVCDQLPDRHSPGCTSQHDGIVDKTSSDTGARVGVDRG